MNKHQLVDALAEATSETKTRSKKFVEAFAEVVQQQLSQGEAVIIADFGKFEAVNYAARNKRNPQTGEVVAMPARKAVKFRPGRITKQMVEVAI